MAAPPLRIEPVESRSALKRFLDMPAPLYADDPHWVRPLLVERMEHLDPGKNPALRHMQVAYWTALRGDRPVGRISAQVNAAHLECHRDATGQFGFIEGEDDAELFASLLGTAEAWLKGRGMRRVTGPFSLSINDESGLLVDGFDRPPSMMMGHHRPYYAARLEQAGYVKAKDLIAYDFDIAADWPAAARRMMARLARNAEVRIRPVDMRRYGEELELMRQIFNDAWADNWGFIPWNPEEVQALGRNIRMLVSADNLAIGEVDGEPAAMVVALPNINEAIGDLGGRLLLFGLPKLLWRLKVKGLRSGRMPLLGVRRRYHGTAKGAALALGVIEAMRDRGKANGFVSAELSWILEDNRPIRDMIELVGGKPYKTYRVYEKALA
ncbi:MAG TPA: dATP pyrophosphohydrolase [Geminicoccaceae bacterium]|nr:dATP pyrophosphohydrolase [Geminicoccus sp.]HMU51200.1 dATP pyrophosphohydrolase [Geminicoccaceae bacterium]